MNFYAITNGYICCYGNVKVFVSAENEKEAKMLASVAFKAKELKRKLNYDESYRESFWDEDKLEVMYTLSGEERGVTEVNDC